MRRHADCDPAARTQRRHAEFGRQFHSLGLRHLRGDLLQEVEALIRNGVGPPGQFCVEVVLALHIGQVESNLPELADFVRRKRVELPDRIIALAREA